MHSKICFKETKTSCNTPYTISSNFHKYYIDIFKTKSKHERDNKSVGIYENDRKMFA